MKNSSQCNKKALGTSSKTPAYEVYIFLLLFFEFLFYIQDISKLNIWNTIYYVLSYDRFGLKPRIVLGSIINLFTDYITNKTIYVIIVAFTVFLIIFVSAIVGKIAREIHKSIYGAEGLIILLLASPASIFYLFISESFGRFDLQLILISIFLLFCIRSEKAKWLAPFLCLLAMLFNQNFVIMYMPVIGIVMLYEYFNGRHTKTRLIIFVVSCLTVIISYLYLVILSPASNFESVTELKNYLAQKTDVAGAEMIVVAGFLVDYVKLVTVHIKYDWVIPIASTYGIYILIATAPLLAVLFSFWINAIKFAQNKSKKFVFLLCLLAPVGELPMFVGVDWNRWIATIFISQFMLILYLFAVNDKDAIKSMIKLKSFFERHYLLFFIILIYSASFIFSNLLDIFLRVLSKYYYNPAQDIFPK